MINFRSEGYRHKLGLNITVTRAYRWWQWSISFDWMWYDSLTYKATVRRIRFRPWLAPRILPGKRTYNVVENYLMMKGLEAVPMEILEDYVPREHWPKEREGHLA